jgi:arylsulfatase A-like enzyme
MASMLKSTDESIGRIVDKLDDLGIADDTIVIFTSDNGGNMYNEVEGRPPTNNAPLRSGKGSIYEGGVRTPAIVVWPGVAKPGAQSPGLLSSVDYYPTMLEMAGIKPREGQVLDGESIVPLLRGAGRLEREAIFCHFPHYVAATGNRPSTSVRKGDWKLIRFYGEGPERSNGYELYNLRDDIGETNNLAAKAPGRVRELDALIDRFLADTGAIVPVRNPAYNPKAGPVRR